MSGITVEMSELDADLWEAFKRGDAWVSHSEYMRVVADNAKLRMRVASLESALEGMHLIREMDLADNAKLRELVRDMYKALFSLNLDHCQACPREDACVFMHKSFDCGECAFERDMRELGVEVPNGEA